MKGLTELRKPDGINGIFYGEIMELIFRIFFFIPLIPSGSRNSVKNFLI